MEVLISFLKTFNLIGVQGFYISGKTLIEDQTIKTKNGEKLEITKGKRKLKEGNRTTKRYDGNGIKGRRKGMLTRTAHNKDKKWVKRRQKNDK